MKEIIDQYGGAILGFVVTLALIGILVGLLNGSGVVAQAFQGLIDSFLNSASQANP